MKISLEIGINIYLIETCVFYIFCNSLSLMDSFFKVRPALVFLQLHVAAVSL